MFGYYDFFVNKVEGEMDDEKDLDRKIDRACESCFFFGGMLDIRSLVISIPNADII